MTKQFKDETREQKIKLLTAWLDGEVIEARYDNRWVVLDSPSWSGNVCYRIEATADTVPWDAICDDYQWYARDKDGFGFVYKDQPKQREDCWTGPNTARTVTGLLANHKIGTCNWKDSLQERPKS